jgi:hypothetical protein
MMEMLERTNGEDDKILTKEEERLLRDSLRKALVSAHPNPNRAGCPDPKTIRDLAFHKPLGNPALFEEIMNHVAGCSPCVRDALGYGEQYKAERRKRRNSVIAFSLAAALAVTFATWVIWQLQHQPRNEEIVGDAPPIHSPTPSVTTGAEKPPEIAQYEAVTIELPPRWRGGTASEPPLILPRGRLLLEIRLPPGSPEGMYKLRILDRAGKVRKSAESNARSISNVPHIRIAFDISVLSPGDYSLSVLEPGLDEWFDYELKLR